MLIEAAQQQSFTSLRRFADKLLVGADTEALLYGNLDGDEAQQLADMIDQHLLVAGKAPELAQAQVVKMSAGEAGGKPWLRALAVDHQDNAVALYFQGLDDSMADAAHMQVLRQTLRAPFFHELRTEKQLGYIVFATAMGLKDVPGSALVVQSPKASADDLVGEISGFVERFGPLSAADLTQHIRAVADRLREQPRNQAEQGQRHWDDILHENAAFDRREQLARAVEKVTGDSYAQYFSKVLQDPQRLLWLTSRDLSEGRDSFRPIDSQATFKAGLPSYDYP